MKTNWVLFTGIGLFYSLMAAIYWVIGGEPVGIACLILSAALAFMVGFYVTKQ